MASVHGFNEALATVRGVPFATIEAYSRVLRREGVLPETRRGGGGGPFTTTMAGYMLAAVLRGSPTAAADNAREVGDLIVHDSIGNPNGTLKGDARRDPILDRQLKALGWPEDMTFARAIGWLIDRYVDGTIKEFVRQPTENEAAIGMRLLGVKIDRYWTAASLSWEPTPAIIKEYLAGYQEAFGADSPAIPWCSPDGSRLQHPMVISFHSPLRYEMKASYGVDKERNRDASRKFSALRKERSKFDLSGSESVTDRTLIAIAEVFK